MSFFSNKKFNKEEFNKEQYQRKIFSANIPEHPHIPRLLFSVSSKDTGIFSHRIARSEHRGATAYTSLRTEPTEPFGSARFSLVHMGFFYTHTTSTTFRFIIRLIIRNLYGLVPVYRCQTLYPNFSPVQPHISRLHISRYPHKPAKPYDIHGLFLHRRRLFYRNSP